MIISLSGHKGSGKNTVADYLTSNYGFTTQLAFASAMKDIMSMMFQWDRTKLDGLTKEDRIWRDTPDIYWSNKTNKIFTPNYAMKEFGSDVIRQWIPDIWVSIIERKLDNNMIITDTRFQNEFDMLKENNAIMISINKKLDTTNLRHACDTTWMTFSFDYSLDNDGTIIELYEQCDKMMESYGILKT
jgi:hypothetical protein